MAVSGLLDTDADHGDDDCRNDGYEARDRKMAHFPQGSRQAEEDADDSAHDAESDGAGRVAGDGVHHDGEREDVAAHGEDEEKELSGPEELFADSASHDLACVGHAVDVWVYHFELSDDVAGVRCE